MIETRLLPCIDYSCIKNSLTPNESPRTGRVVGRDWGRYHENKSYEHFAEERHATLAITDEATNRMKLHKEGDEKDQPLFLYVSYNAAHSPLQTEPDWDLECGHIPHLWRRQFCGMVVGLDKSIGSLVKSARSN